MAHGASLSIPAHGASLSISAHGPPFGSVTASVHVHSHASAPVAGCEFLMHFKCVYDRDGQLQVVGVCVGSDCADAPQVTMRFVPSGGAVEPARRNRGADVSDDGGPMGFPIEELFE